MGILYNVVSFYPLFGDKVKNDQNFRTSSSSNAPMDAGWNNDVTQFEYYHSMWYYFACTRKGVHLYSVLSPGKMKFAVFFIYECRRYTEF